MVDEADVVLIFPPDRESIRKRIEENCPIPTKEGGGEERACLFFVRCGQFLSKEREWVLDELLMVMEERNQKFVLVSAWQVFFFFFFFSFFSFLFFYTFFLSSFSSSFPHPSLLLPSFPSTKLFFFFLFVCLLVCF